MTRTSSPSASEVFVLRPSSLVIAFATLASAVSVLMAASAHAAGTSTITGSVFNDANRNGVRDAGESPFASRLIMLSNSAGVSVASTDTDSNGQFSFPNLSDGTYAV